MDGDLLVHLHDLGSSDSLLFEYTELEDWYEDRKKEPTVSLKVSSQDISYKFYCHFQNLQTLVEGLMKEGKISKRKVTDGNESCDVYWLCYSNEKVKINNNTYIHTYIHVRVYMQIN